MSDRSMPYCREMRPLLYLMSFALALSMPGHPSFAQDTAAPPIQSNAASGTTDATGQMPNDYRLNLLIRTTIIALNQANQTGNYTVLRDLGAPDFQQANTAAKLSEAFAALRSSGFDLSPILFFEPKLVKKPEIQPNGLLRLSGFFQTQPQQVNFDLALQFAKQEWRLLGIALTTSPASSSAGDTPSNEQPQHEKPAGTKDKETAAPPKASKPAQKQ